MSNQFSIEPSGRHLLSGFRISAFSICWTLAASAVSVILGVQANSVVLIAFGLTGILDAAGSISLVVHFRSALHVEVFSQRLEKLSLRIVTTGLVIVGLVTAAGSIQHLANHTDARASTLGVVTSSASVVVLALLAHNKRKIARRIPSTALLADGWLTTAGCLLAVSTVIGTSLTEAFGWWWVDPSMAMVVAAGAVAVAYVLGRSSQQET